MTNTYNRSQSEEQQVQNDQLIITDLKSFHYEQHESTPKPFILKSQQKQISPQENQLNENYPSNKLDIIFNQLQKIITSLKQLIQCMSYSVKKQSMSDSLKIQNGNVQKQQLQKGYTVDNLPSINGCFFKRFFKYILTLLKQSLLKPTSRIASIPSGQNCFFISIFRHSQNQFILVQMYSTSLLAKTISTEQLSRLLSLYILKQKQDHLKSELFRFQEESRYQILLIIEPTDLIFEVDQFKNNKEIQQSLKQKILKCDYLLNKQNLSGSNKWLILLGSQSEISNPIQIDLNEDQIKISVFCSNNLKEQDNFSWNHGMVYFQIPNLCFIKENQCIWKQVKQMTDILKKDHMLGLRSYWKYGMRLKLQQIKQNWSLFKNQLQQQLKTFIIILDYKINRFRLNFQSTNKQNLQFCKQENNCLSLYQLLFPGITTLVGQYSKLLEINLFWMNFNQFKKVKFFESTLRKDYLKIFDQYLRQSFGVQQNQIDQLILFYTLELLLSKSQTQEKEIQIRQGEFLKPVKKCIFQYSKSLHQNYQLQESLIIIKAKVKQIKQKKQANSKRQYFQNIELQRHPEMKCLGCSQFFQFKSNILDETVIQTPLKVFPSIKTIKDYDSQVKQQTCGMLNSSGGVLMFACQGRYKNIIVLGQKITEHEKQDYSQILQHMLLSIYPKIQYNNQIQLTFVPIIEATNFNQAPQLQIYKGEENLIKTGQVHYSQKYMKGVYVARIRVNPTKNHLTYSWERKQGNQSRYFSAIYSNYRKKHLKGHQLIKLIKRRYKLNYIPNQQNLTSIQRKFLSKPQSCFDKPCLLPQQGYKITEIDTVHQYISQKKEDQYRYMSLLIVKQKYLNDIKQKLSKKIRFFIQERFRSYGFKSALCTYILYHDNSFDQLLKIISYSDEFKYQNKITIVIFISEYLKFKDSIPSIPLMNKALEWLRRQFPHETIRFYSYKINNNVQYYAETNTRVSNLFMYYFFNDHKVKTLLKSPHQLWELSPEEKQLNWREISYSNAISWLSM